MTNYAIIGDVHGCYDELVDLAFGSHSFDQYQMIFVGDLTDRGPRNIDVLKLVMSLVKKYNAKVVLGNHDDKLRRWLKGNKVKINNGLQDTINELVETTDDFKADLLSFLEGLPYKLYLDEGKLIIAHAGLTETLQAANRVFSGVHKAARSMALYGKITGKTDSSGYPERLDWAEDYRGTRVVVHGHTANKEVVVKNKVYNIDTGCVFGNKLTALIYPEMSIISVPAKYTYTKHKRLL